MDVGQLAGRVVLIGAFEQGGFVVAAAQQLFLQAPGRVPLLGLQQAVALVADDFAVQVVALVADQFVFVEAQAQQVAAAVGQPADFVAVRAGGGDALVEHVVFVLPHGNHRGLQAQVVLVFAQQVARRVVEPLQAAVGVGGHGQVAVAVVGEGFGLGGAAQACGAFDEAACGVELDVGGALAVDGWTWRTMFFTSS